MERIPSGALTDPTWWGTLGLWLDPDQPAPTAVAGGMRFTWTLHGAFTQAFQGINVPTVAGRAYHLVIECSSASTPWQGGVIGTAVDMRTVTGPGRVDMWFVADRAGMAVGIQVTSPPTPGTHVVSTLSVTDARGPSVRVLAGFGSSPDAATQDWTDITDWVATEQAAITCSRGRSDELTRPEPGRGAVTLDNADGRFTAGYAGSPYYPNVKIRRRLRFQVSPDGWTWHSRFDGYTDEWPIAYAAGDAARAMVAVTATDRLSRLGSARTLRDPLLEELGPGPSDTGPRWILGDPVLSVLGSTTILGSSGPQWLYGCQESAGSTQIGDVSGAGGRPLLTGLTVGGGGTIEMGASGWMPEGTAAQFTPSAAGSGRVLSTASLAASVANELSFWCQFAWSGSTGATFAQLGSAPGTRVVLSATPTTVTATLIAEDGTTATLTKTAVTNDKRGHFALISMLGTTATLYVDGLAAVTGTPPTGMSVARGLTIGGTTSTDVHQVAWVGYSPSQMSASRATDLGTLGSGGSERSDLRVARLLRWLGITDMAIETGQSQIAYQATGDASALDLITAVNDVEGGVCFTSGDGRIVQHSRSHRYARAAAIVLDASDVDQDLTVAYDVTGLANDVTASRPAGATVRVRDEPSISDYGVAAPPAATLYAASDDDLRSAVSWRVACYAQPLPRLSTVTVDLMTCSESARDQILGAEIGDRMQIVGLPASVVPGGAIDVYIEGMTDVIAPDQWRVSLTTSPAWGQVWILGDPVLSVLGSTTRLGY